MPVTVPVTYDIYEAQLAQGGLDLSGLRCPRCEVVGLGLTGGRVSRRVWCLVPEGAGFFRGGRADSASGPGLVSAGSSLPRPALRRPAS